MLGAGGRSKRYGNGKVGKKRTQQISAQRKHQINIMDESQLKYRLNKLEEQQAAFEEKQNAQEKIFRGQYASIFQCFAIIFKKLGIDGKLIGKMKGTMKGSLSVEPAKEETDEK